jgi:16S rRNA (uracil1498-N3)-methyltransferase
MKNVPRIFLNESLQPGKIIPIEKDVQHYLKKVMRTDSCLVFNGGLEFNASLDGGAILIGCVTEHLDPSNDIIFYFAPIKKTDAMLNMVTQMGVAELRPIITDRVQAHHINWERMNKIIIEAAEQSNRNSVPKLFPPIKFTDLNKSGLLFADERAAYGRETKHAAGKNIFIGPEGGFSDAEFAALDAAGAVGISLGRTILRAETAAVAALAKITCSE